MNTLRGRFILSHLLPLLVIVPLAGVALIYLLETQGVLTDLSAELTQQASQIAGAANQADIWDDSQQAQAFVASYRQLQGSEVWLLLPSGQPLATTNPAGQARPGRAYNLPDQEALETNPQPILVVIERQQIAQVFVPVVDVNQELLGIVQVTQELESVSSRFEQLRWLVWGVLAGQLLVGGSVGLVLALRLERPVEAITSAVADIALGQRVEDVPETGPRELRRLAQAVNILSGRLKTLEATRRRLLANLVHELGRPLGAMRSAVHVLRQGGDANATVRQELLAGLEGELLALEPLLDDLIQLHRQTLDSRALERQSITLSAWLPPVLRPWEAAAQAKDLVWQADIPLDLPDLKVDAGRLARALGNLLSNAIKYTPTGGTVRVAAGHDERQVWFQVSDTGPGIPVAEQESIFEPFYRGSAERRFADGLGLGLTIAREIALAHGGNLSLDRHADEGSRFTLALPRPA